MNRTVSLGTVSGDTFGYKSRLAVEVEIRLSDAPNTRLAISGGVWNASKSDYLTCGQCQDTIRELFPNDPNVARLCDIWDRWHLNDMRAGTPAQTKVVEAARPSFAPYPASDYEQSCAALAAVGLLVDESYRVPAPTDEDPTATKGYRYGTQWLSEELPADIVREVANWLPSKPVRSRVAS